MVCLLALMKFLMMGGKSDHLVGDNSYCIVGPDVHVVDCNFLDGIK